MKKLSFTKLEIQVSNNPMTFNAKADTEIPGVHKRAVMRWGATVRALSTNSPPSVSCHTMPSSVTEVPGSQGPRQSGSVIVPTEVPTHTSAVSCKLKGSCYYRKS